MRAISLPVNAIIVIALGLLVLIIGASMVVKGGGGFARVTQQQISLQECQALCATIQQAAFMIYGGGCRTAGSQLSAQITRYCNKGCNDIYTCTVELGTGDRCRVNCTQNTLDPIQ